MPRIRSLKPGYNTSDDIVPLSRDCRYHFALLWTYADDHGKGRDNAKLIRAALWALDDDVDEAQVEAWQAELERHDRIVRYEVEGRRYFVVLNWEKHQHPQRPKNSEFPSPPKPVRKKPRVPVQDASRTDPGHDIAVVVVGEGEVEGDVSSAPLAPKDTRSHLWDACEAVLGPVATSTERSLRGKVVKELLAAGASPEQVPQRAREHRARWPNASLTGPSLIKHWSELATTSTNSRVPQAWHAISEAAR